MQVVLFSQQIPMHSARLGPSLVFVVGFDLIFRGRLKRSARAVQLFGRLAVLETHTLRY